jgi:hypothetical protein
MKYAFEMGSGVMIYVPHFMKIGSGIQKLIRDCISLLSFFQNQDNRLNKSGKEPPVPTG